jgi:hypothetical protein
VDTDSFAGVPDEEWAKVPPAKDLDKHLYADLERWSQRSEKTD